MRGQGDEAQHMCNTFQVSLENDLMKGIFGHAVHPKILLFTSNVVPCPTQLTDAFPGVSRGRSWTLSYEGHGGTWHTTLFTTQQFRAPTIQNPKIWTCSVFPHVCTFLFWLQMVFDWEATRWPGFKGIWDFFEQSDHKRFIPWCKPRWTMVDPGIDE